MKRYLLDTHALIFWRHKREVSDKFISFFDRQAREGALYCSAANFWEIALLVKKGRVSISDVEHWHDELQTFAALHTLTPTSVEMIRSTFLPDTHSDPFDRLLIAQAHHHDLTLVTKDRLIRKYDVETIWL